jgi:hypothetical protein
MENQGIEKRYFSVDTFSGFVPEDVKFETEHRGKPPGLIAGFEDNRKEWFDETMRSNEIRRVESIQARLIGVGSGSARPASSVRRCDAPVTGSRVIPKRLRMP